MNSKTIIAVGNRVRLRHETLGGNASRGTVIDISDDVVSVIFDRGGDVSGIPIGSLTLYIAPTPTPTQSQPRQNYSGVI